MPNIKRVLLIGLDGAEPSLLGPWMDAGRLPHLAALRARGAFLPCASTVPPATFPAWTSCVTGVNPGRHGIVDFTELDHATRTLRFVNATRRDAPAIWTVLSAAGKRVCVLGVPATYPPEPVNGVLVAGFDSPVAQGVDRSFVYPAERYRQVRDWKFADFQEGSIGPGWHERAFERLLQGVATKERIATEMIEEEPWDFFMLVFGESDTVSHHFWLFHDKQSPRYRPGFEDAIRKVYERLDRAVGRLIAAAGDDVFVLVVSDHGFGGAGTGVVHLNNWLAEQGDLAFAPARGSFLKSAALRFAPERWRGALFRRFQPLAARAESRSRFAGIDWPNTRAWSEELNYLPSIRVNLKGRDPEGTIAPEDYDQYCRDLCTRLEAWDAVARAYRRDEIFSGPHVERAPDIIVELALESGYSHSALRARGGRAFRRIEEHEFLGGKEKGMTGNHRAMGVLLMSTPTPATACTLLDVAPTVYAALDVPGPPMEGQSLLGRYEVIPSNGRKRVAEAVYTAAESASIEARLRDLGYFE